MPWRRRRPSRRNTNSDSSRTETVPVGRSSRVGGSEQRPGRADAVDLTAPVRPPRASFPRDNADIPRNLLWHNLSRNADKRDYVNSHARYCIRCIIRPSLRHRFGTSAAVCRPSVTSGEARFCVPATRYQSHTAYRAYAAYRESCQDAGCEHRLQAGASRWSRLSRAPTSERGAWAGHSVPSLSFVHVIVSACGRPARSTSMPDICLPRLQLA